MRKEQLPKFQKQVDAAIIGYLNLLKRKELLSTSIELNKSLVDLEPCIQRGILTIQDTLYASLMVEIHAWLFDRSEQSSNSSLYNLLESLIDSKIKFNTKHLKSYYVSVPKTVEIGVSASNWKQDFVSSREEQFEHAFTECTLHVTDLLSSKQTIRLKFLRDKLLAHKDGIYDVKANGHTIGDVFFLLDHMKIILLNLNSLFQRTSYPIVESEDNAKVEAKLFWNHVART